MTLDIEKNVDDVLKFISDKYFNGNPVPVHPGGYDWNSYVFISEISEGKFSVEQDFRLNYQPAILIYDDNNNIVDIELTQERIEVYAVAYIGDIEYFYPNKYEELVSFFKNKNCKLRDNAKYIPEAKYLMWNIDFSNWGVFDLSSFANRQHSCFSWQAGIQ